MFRCLLSSCRACRVAVAVLICLYAVLWSTWDGARGQLTQATGVPLRLPGGLCYDSGGNLYFAEIANHVVRRVSPAGVISIFAGTGVQGFAGDGGPASAAMLDSPADVALDLAGDLYIADSHNHRVRRVDAVSGIITTVLGTGVAGSSPDGTLATGARLDLPAALAVNAAGDIFVADSRAHLVRRVDHTTGVVTTVAGNGNQGFAGDQGPALAASIDSPAGLALDAAGDLFLSDTHNQRVRRVDAATGVITSVAGVGTGGFSGDAGLARAAAVRLPRGLGLDRSGNLFVVDSANHRIRRIDAGSGVISTVVGNGIQTYAGDLGPAVAASLDSPRGVALSAAGLPVLSDSGNGRVRAVDAAGIIHTFSGSGVVSGGTLVVSGPSMVTYGTGSLTATLQASAATGTVTFFDGATQLGAAGLSGNVATLSTASLRAGTHSLTAQYAGDSSHLAEQSGTLALTVTPAALLATPTAVNLLYGQTVPALTGTLSGVLAQDSGTVSLALSSGAGALSPAGSYPIAGVLAGAGAGNYALTLRPAAVTIARAPAAVTLTPLLAVHVAPTTSGLATGSVSLLDGTTGYSPTLLSATGDAVFSSATLTAGTHSLTAVYGGDGNLTGAVSSAVVVTIGTATGADFLLTATGQTTLTVTGGSTAPFSFAVAPVNGGLSSPIQLTVTGLPTGFTASFSPAYLPPGNTPQAFVLTVQTIKLAGSSLRQIVIYALLVPMLVLMRRRGGLAQAAMLLVLVAVAGPELGCGNRVTAEGASATPTRTYPLVVLGTGTSANGGTVQHSAAVTLTVN